MSELTSELAQKFADDGSEVTVKSPQPEITERQDHITPRYRLAPKYKGKFAMLIKATYDEGMFVKPDGTPATDVEDLAHYIGHALGEDYPDWRQTLRGAVMPKSSLQFFKQLFRWAKRYKDKVVNK